MQNHTGVLTLRPMSFITKSLQGKNCELLRFLHQQSANLSLDIVKSLYLRHLPLALLLAVLYAVCVASPGDAVPQARDARWAVPVPAEGLPNLFRVTPDIYRSAQPKASGMRAAKELGVRTVLSLRRSNQDPELMEGTGLTLRRVPIATWRISEAEMVAALRIIVNAPKPILVHCLHGADRTGLAIALYRMIFQGWSKEDAKAELLNGGYGFHSIWANIPKFIDEADIESLRAQVLAKP